MELSLATTRGKLVLVAAILASGFGFLMNSAINIALPTIQSTFDTTIMGVQWIVNAYILMLGSLILLSGALGDIFGVGRVFKLGILVSVISTVLCGLAWSIPVLIAFRAVQGIGAALMVPGSLSIIKTSYPKEEQGRTVGLWAGVSGAIAALGPLVGGALAEISWRLVFLGTFPIALFALIVTVKTIPRLETREGVKLDVAGSLLIFVGLLGFSFALIRFPAGGMSPPVIAAAAVSLIAVLGFFFVESRSKSPLIPARLFNRTVTVSNVLTFFQYFAFSGLLFLLSFNLQQLQGLSATVAGLALLPTTGLITFLSGPSGAVTDKIGARLQMWLGPLIFTAGVALLLTAGREASYFAVFLPGLALVGLGMVTIIPAVTTSALEVTGELTGAASGMNNAVSRVSGLFATALVGSILAAVFSARLEALLSASDLSREIVSQLLAQSEQLLAMSIPEELSVGEAESVRRILERAYVDGYRAAVGVIGGASAAAGLVAGIWFPRRGARERS